MLIIKNQSADDLDTQLLTSNVALLQKYLKVRQHSEDLTAHLSGEDCNLQAADFTSPAKWHLAHTSWFFETFILIPSVQTYLPFNPRFQYLFNSYYQAVGEQYPRPKRHLLARPDLLEVKQYRQHVNRAMQDYLQQPESVNQYLVELGLQHEQQHQELLLMDLQYCFFQNPLFPAYYPSPAPLSEVSPAASAISFLPFAAGIYPMGSETPFHFDNESPVHDALLQPFALADRLVSNDEYLKFIQAGGYQNSEYWLSDGWAWRNSSQTCLPLYWVQQDEVMYQFSLHGLRPLNLNAPVRHISFYEAYAYAAWAGLRLPTEQEWEVAATSPQAQRMPDLMNCQWQWTQSPYQAYPGFTPSHGAIGEYNGKFMCNQMVLRGGCEFSPLGHARPHYRNFFYPHDQWPLTGIRLAKTL